MKLYKNPNITEMFCEEDEEYILYDSATSKVKMMNKTGAFIWLQLPDKDIFEREDCITELAKKFQNINTNIIAVTNDISEFIKSMIREGVLLEAEV